MKEIDLKKVAIYCRLSKEPEETEEEKTLKKLSKILNERFNQKYNKVIFTKRYHMNQN